MRILHIFDKACFGVYEKTISELVMALGDYRHEKVEQGAYAPFDADFGELPELIPFERYKPSFWSGKVQASRAAARFAPDAVIKWGAGAQKFSPEGNFITLSFVGAPNEVKPVPKSDYVIANSESILAHVKTRGFSGAKSFLLQSFAYDYKDVEPITKQSLFIPEHAQVIYMAGTLLEGIGFEWALESMASVPNVYFIISGRGRDEGYITNFASNVNIRSRTRIVREVPKSGRLLEISDLALLPFSESAVVKSMIEASLARKPIITTRNQYSADYITDGVNGIAVKEKDTYLLKKACREVLAGEFDADTAQRALDTARGYQEAAAIAGLLSNIQLLSDKYRTRRNLL